MYSRNTLNYLTTAAKLQFTGTLQATKYRVAGCRQDICLLQMNLYSESWSILGRPDYDSTGMLGMEMSMLDL